MEKDGVDVFDLLQRASESHTAYQQHGPPAFADPAAAADRPRHDSSRRTVFHGQPTIGEDSGKRRDPQRRADRRGCFSFLK